MSGQIFVCALVLCACVCVCVCVSAHPCVPDWLWYPYRYLTPEDAVVISVWNARKSNRGDSSAGFLGCVRLKPQDLGRLKDTGCEHCLSVLSPLLPHPLCPSPSDQHLELTKGRSSEEIAVKGHVVISLTCSDRQSSVTTLLAHSSADQLPEG